MKFFSAVTSVSGLSAFLVASGLNAQPKNILFIAIDDLKPLTGAYGDKHAKTPGMDRLSREGILFRNTFCQQAISAATRASLLTGMYPDKTRVWDLITDFRQVNPNALSMPEYFKSKGYLTAGMGKIFHNESAGPGHDAPSWSIRYRNSDLKQYMLPYTPNKLGRGPATECAEVSDNSYRDGEVAEMAVQLLDSLSANSKPFFLAVGFLKPHLPFVAPKKYWDMYDRNEFELASFQEKALNSPDLAYHNSGELKNYSDIPLFDNYSENELDHLPVEKQKELIHGYYAAMSYTDAQILKLLDELDKLGIRKNTIIVLWGDHGWHLGDHGLWNKHSNFEQATHVPLIMSVPGQKSGVGCSTISEFTDIFPTLCELTGIPIPEHLDGVSLVPAMKKQSSQVREYALSQYPRGKRMGYSIRTERFRYTVWVGNGFRTWMPYNEEQVVARELYDYEKDPLEKENVLEKPEYKNSRLKMESLFQDCMKREFSSCARYSKIADYRKPVSTAKN